jgi:tetraacyldisaccharide 4'-kinase
VSPEVLDWRGGAGCLAATLWRDDDAREERRGALAALSALTSPLQRAALRRRVARRGEPPSRPLIVSIGNLRVGGTGKTPVTIALAAELARRGVPGVIVTRGYGATVRGPRRVRPDDGDAADEARLLAARVPGWPVIQAADRQAGIALALTAGAAPQIVLLEDGHQTARVPRHLDVLILDRWRRAGGPVGERIEPLTGPLLPWGPYREGVEGALRSACWLVEPPTGDPGAWLAAAQPATGRGPAGGVILGFRRAASLAPQLRPRLDEPYGVLSGIARPAAFETGCAGLLGWAPRAAIRCDDHAAYTPELAARLLAAGRERGVAVWLTTEKDAVKLAPVWPGPEPLRPVLLEVAWLGTKTLPDLIGERLASG